MITGIRCIKEKKFFFFFLKDLVYCKCFIRVFKLRQCKFFLQNGTNIFFPQYKLIVQRVFFWTKRVRNGAIYRKLWVEKLYGIL